MKTSLAGTPSVLFSSEIFLELPKLQSLTSLLRQKYWKDQLPVLPQLLPRTRSFGRTISKSEQRSDLPPFATEASNFMANHFTVFIRNQVNADFFFKLVFGDMVSSLAQVSLKIGSFFFFFGAPNTSQL